MAKTSSGITGFYKNLLDKTEQEHEELVKASDKSESVQADPVFLISKPSSDNNNANDNNNPTTSKERSEAELAAEINKKAAGTIQVNDEGQVVDKRQLLSAGLNVKPKVSKPNDDPRNRSGNNSHNQNRETGGSRPGYDHRAKKDMRERQSRMIEAQLEEASRKAEQQEEAERKEVERQAKLRKTTEGDVMSARERYLKRKREAEEKKQDGG